MKTPDTTTAGDSKPFPSQATEDDPTSDVRDVAAVERPETVGSGTDDPPQTPSTLKTPVGCTPTEQEQHPGKESSDLVTSKSPLETGVHAPVTIPPTLLSRLLESIPQLTTMLEKRDAIVAKKKMKVNDLKQRQEEVEGFMSAKEDKIKQLDKEAKEMATELEQEQESKVTAEGDLKEKQQKIKDLEKYIEQRDKELQQERDDKKETCAKLKQAQADLEAEKISKANSERRLSSALSRIQHLQEDVDRAEKGVETTREERLKIETVLGWTEKDVTEEEDELNLMLQRQQKYTINTILAFVSFIIIIIALLVHFVPQYCSY